MSKRSRNKSSKPRPVPADKKSRSRRERSAKSSKPEAPSRKTSRRGKKSVVEEVASSVVEAAVPALASVMTAPVTSAVRKINRTTSAALATTVSTGKKGAHPPHPKCSCGRALYKSAVPRQVKPSDPWAWCRNPACPLFGKDQSKISAATPAADAPAVPEPAPAEALS